MNQFKSIFLSALLVSFGFSGCAYVNPYIQEFNVVSVPQEIQLGEQMHQEIAAQKPLIHDPVLSSRINSMGARLVNQLPKKDFEYRFYVVEDETPNAFTIPGARIYVHSGLLKFADSDDMLAGVVAHEIGHAYERHSAKMVSRATGMEQLAGMIFKGEKQKLGQIALGLAGGGILNSYGRQDEREADDIGYYLLRRAGYSENGLLQFLQKLEKLAGPGSSSFMSSHPPTTERIERLQRLSGTQNVTDQPLGTYVGNY